ncbi:MAG: hypothetical protein ACTSXD_08385 [Candidatus Heimdallarchaeaceae archaeon]
MLIKCKLCGKICERYCKGLCFNCYHKEYRKTEGYKTSMKKMSLSKLLSKMDELGFSEKTQEAIVLDGVILDKRLIEVSK